MSKILYAVQATGNGHISRAREIIPHLQNYGEVDVLISGRQAEVNLPYMVKFKKKGLSYTFGKHGGIDFIDSIINIRPINLIKDIYSFPVHNYDLILNDFEPVTAWACKVQKKDCIALSHQSAYLSQKTPRPQQQNSFAEWILRNYAPTTHHYGFHFKSFDDFIYTPVIRNEVRNLEITNKDHITVYLPAHQDDILIKHFSKFKDVKFEVFSKHTKLAFRKDNVHVTPINNELFINSLASSDGVVTAGGFESVAEAIHLRKKVMVIPMHNQYEQQCNAIAARDIGVTKVQSLDADFNKHLNSWLKYAMPPKIYYPDLTAKIISEVISKHLPN